MLTILPDTISPPPAEALRESLPRLREMHELAHEARRGASIDEWQAWLNAGSHLAAAIRLLAVALRARDARLKETP